MENNPQTPSLESSTLNLEKDLEDATVESLESFVITEEEDKQDEDHDIDSDDTFATAKQSTSSASSRAAKPSVSSAGSPVKARLTRSRSRTSLNFSEAQESFISCRNR